MALTISAAHGFVAFNDGTVIIPSMGVRVNGGNAFVQYVKKDGTVTGTDFSANPAMLFPYCMSSASGTVVTPTSNSVKWAYGTTEILFDSSSANAKNVKIDGENYSYQPCTNFLDSNKKAIFGLTEYTIHEGDKTYSVTALVIVGNVASATVFTDVMFKMSGMTADNHSFSCSKVLPIQMSDGESVDAYIVDNGDSVVSGSDTSVVLVGGIQVNGARVTSSQLSNVVWEKYTKDGWVQVDKGDNASLFKLESEDKSATTNKTKITVSKDAIDASLLLRFSADYNNRTYRCTHEVLDMSDGYTFDDGCNYPGSESSITNGSKVTLKPVVKTKSGVVDSGTWQCEVRMTDADGNQIKKRSTDSDYWTYTFPKCDGNEQAVEFDYNELFAEGRTYIKFMYIVSRAN